MSKFPGLEWDPKTGKGRVRKLIRGRSIQRRFQAGTRAEAEACYYNILAQLDAPPPTPSRTFRAAATYYLNTEHKKSLDRDAECLERLDPFIGPMLLEKIHMGSLQGYIDKRKRDGVKSGTVGRELAVVRRILTLASRLWRDDEGRPWLAGSVPLIRLPDWKDKKAPYPLNADEQVRLLEHLPDHLARMVLFAVNTGAREAIICGLRWEWERVIPDLGRRAFVVPGVHTKNETDCLIPINRRAEVVLDAVRGTHPEYVFTFEGRPIQRINNTAWRHAWRAAGLPAESGILAGPHNLRHTFARRLRAARVPHETIKVLMHHVDGDVTLRYAPSELAELFRAVDALEEQKVVLRAVG